MASDFAAGLFGFREAVKIDRTSSLPISKPSYYESDVKKLLSKFVAPLFFEELTYD